MSENYPGHICEKDELGRLSCHISLTVTFSSTIFLFLNLPFSNVWTITYLHEYQWFCPSCIFASGSAPYGTQRRRSYLNVVYLWIIQWHFRIRNDNFAFYLHIQNKKKSKSIKTPCYSSNTDLNENFIPVKIYAINTLQMNIFQLCTLFWILCSA